tara:strand:+ start:84 stop:317 length:234 start_codon:yes stop_codon:yes gene_type:complete
MSNTIPFKDRPQEEQDKMHTALTTVETLGAKMYKLSHEITQLQKKRDAIRVRYHAARDEFYACIGKPNPNPQEVPNA